MHPLAKKPPTFEYTPYVHDNMEPQVDIRASLRHSRNMLDEGSQSSPSGGRSLNEVLAMTKTSSLDMGVSATFKGSYTKSDHRERRARRKSGSKGARLSSRRSYRQSSK